jgi:sarcosine oxidase subunit alpha
MGSGEIQNAKLKTQNSGTVTVVINGTPIDVPEGTMVAAAVALSGVSGFRKSVNGEMRGPLCGMGICMECRVTIDGAGQRRSCNVVCREGMEVRTDG